MPPHTEKIWYIVYFFFLLLFLGLLKAVWCLFAFPDLFRAEENMSFWFWNDGQGFPGLWEQNKSQNKSQGGKCWKAAVLSK